MIQDEEKFTLDDIPFLDPFLFDGIGLRRVRKMEEMFRCARCEIEFIDDVENQDSSYPLCDDCWFELRHPEYAD